MEIHRAPGPPRTSIVLVGGCRVAVLEVGPGHESGMVQHPDRTRWRFRRPPGAFEWWITDEADEPLGTITRTALLRERFTLEIAGTCVEVVPISKPWRRHWSIVDSQGREVMEVIQRPLSRTVHDLLRRSGDLPGELPLAVAWVLALATTDPLLETERRRSSTA